MYDLLFHVKRSTPTFCQGREGIEWGRRGSLGFDLAFGVQTGHIAMWFSMSVAMPGQNNMFLARCLVFSTPR